jgi:hypothetical protein
MSADTGMEGVLELQLNHTIEAMLADQQQNLLTQMKLSHAALMTSFKEELTAQHQALTNSIAHIHQTHMDAIKSLATEVDNLRFKVDNLLPTISARDAAIAERLDSLDAGVGALCDAAFPGFGSDLKPTSARKQRISRGL